MELTVTQAQLIYDELAKSTDPIIVAARVELLEAIENVKETGDEYDLSVTIIPDEAEDGDEKDTEGPDPEEPDAKEDSQRRDAT